MYKKVLPSHRLFKRFEERIITGEVGLDDERQDQTQRIDDHMALATLDFFARVVPTVPPFSAVLTDWLSMMPAEGVGFFPAFRHAWLRRPS